MKGAPMTLLARSAHMLTEDGIRSIDDAAREAVTAANPSFASRGLRVLGLAYCTDRERPDEHTGHRANPLSILDDDLVFVGLVGMEDAPVPGIESVVSHLRSAGLRTIMLTGDQRLTAETLARRIGILAPGEESLDAEALAALPTRELARRLARVTVVSRVSPADKLRVVHALREAGEIVAMIGDGVNDAPALKSADIGIAMGIRGTDVAKQAAAMVLQDDRLETVSAAIEEGRVIFDNIQKAVLFLFSCNIAEVLVLLLTGVVGLPLPLAPLQILWLNLVTDTLPAIALALEPAEPNLMRRPPARANMRILSGPLLRSIFVYSALITTTTLAAFGWALSGGGDPARASTIAWMTLALSQLFHVGNVRGADSVLTVAAALRNRFAVTALVIGVALQVAALEIPRIAHTLGVRALSSGDWAVVLAFALAPALIGQLWKLTHPTRPLDNGARA
jgi:Ca2+-transporting ATPase